MADERVRRRLTAILAADVAGYSRLMGADEAGTRARFNAHMGELIEPAIADRHGRIVKTVGDGLLVEFASVVDAVQCAVDIQQGMAARNAGESDGRKIVFRIGVNLGDVIVEGDDIHGDGVNVAARLEALAEPGGICLSRAARDQIRDRMDIALEDMGEVAVKNIVRPIRAFRTVPDGTVAPPPAGRKRGKPGWLGVLAVISGLLVVAGAALFWLKPWGTGLEAASIDRMAFPLPARPSIAVLPFADRSAAKDQEYFADGITDDIVTDLSKVSGLFVVARGSTSAYRRKPAPVRQVAEDLGVRYVLEGSVRRAGKKIRVTAQIIDALKGEYLWSDRYDREVNDIFAVQSEITEQVVRAMSVTLKANEHDRIFQKYVANIDAYDTFIRARSAVDAPSRANIEKGEKLFRRTIELDPGFAGGYAGLSFNYSVKARFGYGKHPREDAKKSLELAQKAIALDARFPWSYIALAGAYLANGQQDNAVDAARRALAIQPNDYEANLFMGFYLNFAGQPDLAVRYLEAANDMSRIDTVRGVSFLGMAYFTDRRYADSISMFERRFEKFGIATNPIAHIFLAASLEKLGQTAAAAKAADRFRRLKPGFRMSKWRWVDNYKRQEDRRQLRDAAVAAGIPE